MRIFILLVLITTSLAAQEHVLVKSGYGAAGYDLISYFEGEPEKGDKAFQAEHQGVSYKFISEEHLKSFKKDPERYLPQYGGYCAYAMALKGDKVGVNPKTFLITGDKLYLFYNKFGVNTLKKWEKENPEQLKQAADVYYKALLDQ
ncbi:YHS domain-containing (seleno)protein [Aureitalea marina]|uniref:YHS domain-containing protein n=1 Tax=Aureitalea marina TaxID=930804 RepID=A0A2S7KSK1_9FLAO|nr:YHS domain-containing (seleno)protein [Aureitalea marina]PQB05558.1 hypothetical protein BST85_12110 [Aureitalea marina]